MHVFFKPLILLSCKSLQWLFLSTVSKCYVSALFGHQLVTSGKPGILVQAWTGLLRQRATFHWRLAYLQKRAKPWHCGFANIGWCCKVVRAGAMLGKSPILEKHQVWYLTVVPFTFQRLLKTTKLLDDPCMPFQHPFVLGTLLSGPEDCNAFLWDSSWKSTFDEPKGVEGVYEFLWVFWPRRCLGGGLT